MLLKEKISSDGLVQVFVPLLEEGSPASQGTWAVPLSNGTYKLLARKGYNPESETWEFLPDSIVRCEWRKSADGEDLFTAVKQVG